MGTMTESAKALLPELIKIRRDFHEYPELSGKEEETAKKVAAYLKEMGCDQVIEHVGGHGVIGVIKGASEGGVVALRADMDALQIQEMNETEYRSRNDGVMHACGHDNHMTGLLGAAKLLLERRDQIHGTVKLVFQPAEENGGGGREMIKAGLMEEKPDACFALHVKNGTSGLIYLKQKYLSSYSDGYTLTIHGRAAHSSMPEEGVDAIYIASAVVSALHGIASRNLSPMAQATLNVGTIHGGSAPNIIADQAVLGVMMRNVSRESRDVMRHQIETLAKGITESMGGTCDIAFRAGYPAVYNDVEFTKTVEQAFRSNADRLYENMGDGRPEGWLITDLDPMLGAEDFGFFAQEAPSCMIFVGTGGDAPMHNPGFQVDERYIKLCTRAMAFVAAEYLK